MSHASNIKHNGLHALKVGNNIIFKSIKEAVQNINAIETKSAYAKRKFKYHWNVINGKARNMFLLKLTMLSIIKCTHGLNHYGLRCKLINSTNSKFFQCNYIETWEHVMCCRKTAEFRKQFAIDLLNELMRSRTEETRHNELFDIIEDIL